MAYDRAFPWQFDSMGRHNVAGVFLDSSHHHHPHVAKGFLMETSALPGCTLKGGQVSKGKGCCAKVAPVSGDLPESPSWDGSMMLGLD